MICRRCFISGRVQGVFFRQSTLAMARRLQLTGWVRNRRDGRVEVLAQGAADNIEALQKWLQIGPDGAKVSNIECSDEPPDEQLTTTGFAVRATL